MKSVMKEKLIGTALMISVTLFLSSSLQVFAQSVSSQTAAQSAKKMSAHAGAAEDTSSEQKSVTILTAEKKKIAVEEPADAATLFWNTYIRNHLQFGTRSIYRILTDDNSGHRGGTYGSGTFLGTIYGLEEKQNISPTAVNIAYFFNDYFGVHVAYDQMGAETRAIDSYTGSEKTDGDVSLSGPSISLLARFVNKTTVTPYVGAGVGLYTASFDATSEWTLSSRYAGRAYNHMDVEDVTAWNFIVGADWLFYEQWALDLMFQYTKADVDATYRGYYDDELYTTQEGHFPLDNIAVGVGLSYHF